MQQNTASTLQKHVHA